MKRFGLLIVGLALLPSLAGCCWRPCRCWGPGPSYPPTTYAAPYTQSYAAPACAPCYAE